ncbi:MAG: HigA family addiction module antidote protein [Gemmatimonadaceae bacterium]|nr:HigA family addiction module antidote protein [Gemmatimonadaceae bacterium]
MVRIPTHRPPTHPGEMLLEEFLKPLSITQVDFAERIGVSMQRLNEIVRRKRGVTPDTALRLEAALGASAQFWLNLQLAYDLYEQMHAPAAAEIRKIRRVRPEHRASA